MSEEEKKLYDVLFPNDNNPYYINYAYFTGGSMRSLSILKSKIKNSYIEPILLEAEKDDGSFFIKVLQKDVDIFLNMIKPLKYNERKISKKYISKIKALFGDN
ncbi:hypothetical protein [Clostridium magnum]|uniref:Uncharacterized protein n=1 Tax=Clostridium magnum DSM 2767 TaxID=1121326 RepID=A0A162RTN2_9CLOT|nr:hypothetical protein [Clostridium magnum]KZL90361.1 hypothetical protein CLMAG_41320 [Clostridium magnum DSM 2767]SHH83090.1 hypothetical protein SAMN02745944_01511 [Clostridium magnum DSM 2767]